MKRARDVLNRPFAPRYLKLILQGAVVGLITGCVVSLFRWIIDHTLQILFVWYPYLNEHKLYLLPYILFLLCLSLILGKLLKKDTLDLVGSGVPQIEAVLLGQHHLKWPARHRLPRRPPPFLQRRSSRDMCLNGFPGAFRPKRAARPLPCAGYSFTIPISTLTRL